jgi:hypothetical protein
MPPGYGLGNVTVDRPTSLLHGHRLGIHVYILFSKNCVPIFFDLDQLYSNIMPYLDQGCKTRA